MPSAIGKRDGWRLECVGVLRRVFGRHGFLVIHDVWAGGLVRAYVLNV